jgi:hypothetical protein
MLGCRSVGVVVDVDVGEASLKEMCERLSRSFGAPAVRSKQSLDIAVDSATSASPRCEAPAVRRRAALRIPLLAAAVAALGVPLVANDGFLMGWRKSDGGAGARSGAKARSPPIATTST